MQCNLLSSKVYSKLDKINCKFLWGNSSSCKKMHNVSWDMVTLPKHLGGLGIRKSLAQNKAILAKRVWPLRTNSYDAWAETLRKEYPITYSATKRKSSVWASIQKANIICDKGTRWLIRNRESIRIWQDDWTGHDPICKFLQGPLHANDPSLKVKDTWDTNSNWDLSSISFVLPSQVCDTIRVTLKPFHSSLDNLPT